MTGETLEVRLARSAVPLDEALRIGIGIADALDRGHREGVVHTDLRPANILLTETGPQLLDVGVTPSGADPDADVRTDILAFGEVLQGMIASAHTVPPALTRVVKACLARDPDDRWQTARDLVAELRWIAEGSGSVTRAGAAVETGFSGSRVMRGLLMGAGLLIAALSVPAVLFLRGGPPPEKMEIRVPTSPLNYSNDPANNGVFSISPDGRRLVVSARPSAASPSANVPYSLYVATIDFLNPVHLAGTDLAFQPFWSPGGREIAYVASGKLMKIEASGGPARPICDVSGFRGGTWNRDGTILFGSSSGIFSVPSEGGTPAAVTAVEANEAGHLWPRFLPDGRQFLYLALAVEGTKHTLMAGSLDSKKRTVIPLDSQAGFTSGYLVFRRETSIYAQRFDPDDLVLSGEPIRLADGIPRGAGRGRDPFEVSENGVLAYYRDLGDLSDLRSADTRVERDWQLAWISRTAQVVQTAGKPGVYRGLEVSPDGTRIASHRHDAKGGDVFVLEPGGTETRITFEASQDNSNPVWSTDGLRITYASLRNGKWGLYQTASDGSGKEELLVESELPKVPLQWSAGAKYLLFWVSDPETLGDLWVWPTDDRKARPLIATKANEKHGQISPDGKWIAYSSSLESQRQIYVHPFPSGTGRWQVTSNRPEAGNNPAGAWPRWSQAANELFYLSAGTAVDLPRRLFSVPWKTSGSSFIYDPPRPFIEIFAVQYPHDGGDYHTYAVSPDGQRLLVYQSAPPATTTLPASETPDPRSGLTVILNWAQGIKR